MQIFQEREKDTERRTITPINPSGKCFPVPRPIKLSPHPRRMLERKLYTIRWITEECFDFILSNFRPIKCFHGTTRWLIMKNLSARNNAHIAFRRSMKRERHVSRYAFASSRLLLVFYHFLSILMNVFSSLLPSSLSLRPFLSTALMPPPSV